MDAFVTRATSVGPSRTRDSVSSKRLPSSSSVPSFFAANKILEKTSHTKSTNSRDKGKGRASTEAPVQAASTESPLSKRAQSVPAAHSLKLKQTVINITKSLKSADNPVTHSSSCMPPSQSTQSSQRYLSISISQSRELFTMSLVVLAIRLVRFVKIILRLDDAHYLASADNGKSREGMKSHTLSRNAKLKAQGAEAQTGVFKGVKAYINGTTMPLISNLDLIRLIQENGGDVKYAFSKTGCTHIICVHGLSSQKTHKELNGRSKTKVVTPEWVLDSIFEGKKLAESRYKILNSETQSSIRTAFADTNTAAKAELMDEDGDLSCLSKSRVQASSSPRCPSPKKRGGRIRDGDVLAISDSEEKPIVISSSQ